MRNYKHGKHRLGFTLLEVMLALAVLVTGLTAVVSIYMVSLQWIEEIRVDLTALQTGRAVLADAGILTDRDHARLNHSNKDAEAKGWLNDYYVVRTTEEVVRPNFPVSAGTYLHVRIQVYFGGTDEDGILAHDFTCDQIMLEEYNP